MIVTNIPRSEWLLWGQEDIKLPIEYEHTRAAPAQSLRQCCKLLRMSNKLNLLIYIVRIVAPCAPHDYTFGSEAS